jgi:cystine transport system substrate-binding protein
MVAYLLNNSRLPLKAGARLGNVERMGVTFQKNNPKFNEAINKALGEAGADGSLKRASERWFGVDVSHQ